MYPQTLNYPYLIETSTQQIKKYSKTEADIEATRFQENGTDVEVYHKGLLQYRLNGIHQGELFQQ